MARPTRWSTGRQLPSRDGPLHRTVHQILGYERRREPDFSPAALSHSPGKTGHAEDSLPYHQPDRERPKSRLDVNQDKDIDVDSWLLFYKNFFIYGDLDYEDAALLKNYLFAFGKHPKHLTYLEKFTDFRKCTLDVRDGVQMCRYGLANLAPETKDTLLGTLGNDKAPEKFAPHVYFQKKEAFSVIKPETSKSDGIYDLLSLDLNPMVQDPSRHRDEDCYQQGLVKYQMSVLKVGNFLLPMLANTGNSKLESNFLAAKTQIRSILEHYEKVILNQISAVESSTQKKTSALQAIIFNEVNRSVVYYPFSKFSLASLPAPYLHFVVRKFLECLSNPSIADLECHLDGFNLSLTKWNQRTILVFSEDRKLAPKDFNAQLASFRASLTDIFI